MSLVMDHGDFSKSRRALLVVSVVAFISAGIKDISLGFSFNNFSISIDPWVFRVVVGLSITHLAWVSFMHCRVNLVTGVHVKHHMRIPDIQASYENLRLNHGSEIKNAIANMREDGSFLPQAERRLDVFAGRLDELETYIDEFRVDEKKFARMYIYGEAIPYFIIATCALYTLLFGMPDFLIIFQ